MSARHPSKADERDDQPTHHEPSLIQYFAVFIFLLVMTGITTGVAFINLGLFNPIVALTIAVMKAVAVILIFMHVWASTRLTKLTVVAGFFFLAVLLTLTSIDYISRPWSAPSAISGR
jgi:cytochrome c oxidase subunit IV